MNIHSRMPKALKAKVNAALAAQWPRRSCDMVQVDLPLPISANDLWRPDGRGGIIKTERYEGWLVVAGTMINEQRPGKIEGAYALTLIISRRRCRIDLDNAVKAASDALQANYIIDNDRLAEQITLRWSDSIDGMRAFIEPFRKATAA